MHRVALLFLFWSLAACTTAGNTPADGVSVSQLTPTTLQIAARGPRGNDKNYALFKAAEEAVRLGFDVLVLVSEVDRSRTAMRVIPTVTSVMGNMPGGGATVVSPADVEIVPGRDFVVELRRGPKPANAPANVYDARELIAVVGPQARQ